MKQIQILLSGPSSVEEAVACFRTIGHLLNLPIKTDLLRRVFSEQVSQDDGTIFYSLQLQLWSLGLQSQLLDLPCHLLKRLQVPALCICHNEFAVILDISDTKLLIARPQSGIQSLSHDQFQIIEDEGSFPVLLLRTTHRTPQKRFGLSWFLPSIARNKKPLIEVLVASLFVQLFQLMNPLIVQQIIDKVIGQNGMSTLPVLAVLLFSFSTFENVLTAVRTNLFIETTNRIDLSLGEQVIDHLLRLPLSYFDKRPVGELSSRLSELEQIRSFLTGTALTVVLDSVFSIIYIVVMIFYSWILTIVALIVAPLLALLTFDFSCDP